MMWMEGVGWLGGRPPCKGTKARNQCQEPLVSCNHRAWIEATCCSQSARGEKFELQNAEGQMLELLMGDSVESATIQHGITSWTKERILR
jgi:hypothetical protein